MKRAAFQVPAWAAGTALALAVVAAYAPTLENGFIWDDPRHVTENAALRSLDGLGSIWFDPTSVVPQYYPLTFTSLWVEHRLWGLDPRGYHWVSILLHAASSLLVWRLLRRLGLPGAYLAAAVFALHPVHVESVAWVSERKNTLSGLFYLLTLLACPWLVPSPRDPADRSGADSNAARGSMGAYALMLLLFLSALLSKTVTVSLPAAILLLIWWKRGRVERSEAVAVAPMFAVGMAFAAVTVWMEKYHVRAQGESWDLGVMERALIAGRAIWFYAWKLVWPAELIFVYPRWTIHVGALWQWVPPAAVAVLVALLFLLRKRIGRGPLVATLFFIGTLFPALGFFDVYPMRYSFVADHFQYLASLGPIALAAGLVGHATSRLGPRGRLAVGAACLMALLTLAAQTRSQCRIYRDEETLWTDTAAKNATAWIAYNNLGTIHAARGEDAEAMAFYRKALALEPDIAETQRNLGLHLMREGRVAQAAQHFRKALELRPDHLPAQLNLASALRRLGRAGESAAILGGLLDRSPGDAAARFELAMALAAQGQLVAAVPEFRRSLESEPDNPVTHEFLGQTLLLLGRADDAARHLERSIGLDPARPDPRAKLAWLLATRPEPGSRDPGRAVDLAEGAMRDGDRADPGLLDALGAAYAASGRFDEAVMVAGQAAERARQGGQRELSEAIERRIELYRRGRRYVAAPPTGKPAGVVEDH